MNSCKSKDNKFFYLSYSDTARPPNMTSGAMLNSTVIWIREKKEQAWTNTKERSMMKVKEAIESLSYAEIKEKYNLREYSGPRETDKKVKKIKGLLMFEDRKVCADCGQEMKETAPARGNFSPRWICGQCNVYWTEPEENS